MITFEFTPPGESKTFLAVGQPLQLEGQNFGALIVAKKKTELTNGWFSLFELLLVALGVGLLVAGALAWYLSRRIAKPVLALSEAADRIAEGKYDIAVPDVPGSGEVSHLAERFREMASRLAEAEEQERNFLMSVSHELRTPLTAIRGHVEALREGLIDDPDAEAESLSVVAMEAERLERLVGDVLDLAKLDAHRFTVLHEEVDMGSLVDQVYAAFGEEARRRGIDYVLRRQRRRAGDRLGRRPRLPDRLQPALQRVPLDAGRRPRSSSRSSRRTAPSRSRSPTPARGSSRPTRSGSSARSGRATAAAPGSGWRSPVSWRSRSAGGSSSRASRARAAGST